MNNLTAAVNKVELINHNVYQVNLNIQMEHFIAGQYLMVQLPTGESVPYSIGSAPHLLPELVLYIQVVDEDSLAYKVITYLKANSDVDVKIAGGDCHIENGVLNSEEKTIEKVLLIAGGTGFAQMKSMYDSLIKQKYQGEFALYWGVRTPEDSFLNEWIESKENVHIVVSEADSSWQGNTGWLYEKIIADNDFQHTIAYVSGSPAMVYGTLDKLEEAGLEQNMSFSDVFAYAPRPTK